MARPRKQFIILRLPAQDTCSYRNFFQVQQFQQPSWLEGVPEARSGTRKRAIHHLTAPKTHAPNETIPAASFARGTFGRSGIGRTFWHGQKIKQFPEFLIFHLCLVLLPWRHRTSLAMCVNEVCLFLSTRNPKPSLRLNVLLIRPWQCVFQDSVSSLSLALSVCLSALVAGLHGLAFV